MKKSEHQYTVTIHFEGCATAAVVRLSGELILNHRAQEVDVESFFSEILGVKDVTINLMDVVDGSITALSLSRVTHLRVEKVKP